MSDSKPPRMAKIIILILTQFSALPKEAAEPVSIVHVEIHLAMDYLSSLTI